ncbi:glutathione S-transferase family protein [Paraferrimonas haliotis]|uniref:glutathione S-transferase family protein n=1 Tax=Paraferrimonas haliotis TaxID=2013866 RepID=UPI000BA99EFF|nr:glutathione S-transferase family protein [Paraferrimonas haliotis]
MKIISFKICPFVQRVTALLEAKGIAYDVEYISLSEKPQWFLDVSPNGQVPVLITDNGAALFESEAIVEYLEEVSDIKHMGDSAEQRALARAWGYLAAKTYLPQCGAMSASSKSSLQERHDKLRVTLNKLEKALPAEGFFSGQKLGWVDIAWLPILHRFEIIKRCAGFDFLEGFSKVTAWQQRLMKTGIAEQSVADDFEEKFVGYYLSNSTYLGQLRGERSLGKCCAANCC